MRVACRYFYVNTSPSAGGVQDAFYTDATASTNYQNHVKTLVNHVNSITGVVSPAVHSLDPAQLGPAAPPSLPVQSCSVQSCSGVAEAAISNSYA